MTKFSDKISKVGQRAFNLQETFIWGLRNAQTLEKASFFGGSLSSVFVMAAGVAASSQNVLLSALVPAAIGLSAAAKSMHHGLKYKISGEKYIAFDAYKLMYERGKMDSDTYSLLSKNLEKRLAVLNHDKPEVIFDGKVLSPEDLAAKKEADIMLAEVTGFKPLPPERS